MSQYFIVLKILHIVCTNFRWGWKILPTYSGYHHISCLLVKWAAVWHEIGLLISQKIDMILYYSLTSRGVYVYVIKAISWTSSVFKKITVLLTVYNNLSAFSMNVFLNMIHFLTKNWNVFGQPNLLMLLVYM